MYNFIILVFTFIFILQTNSINVINKSSANHCKEDSFPWNCFSSFAAQCVNQLQCLQSIENKISTGGIGNDLSEEQRAVMIVDQALHRFDGLFYKTGPAWGWHCVTDDCIIMCFYFTYTEDQAFFMTSVYQPSYIAAAFSILKFNTKREKCCTGRFKVEVDGSINCLEK